MQPVGLPAIAWMPPYVAHVPAATTAQAFGASWSIHQLTVSGSPVAGSLALDDEDEGRELAPGRREERREELVAAERRREHLVVQVHLRQPGDVAVHDVLDPRQLRRRHRDRV